ncbi:bifunctional salicylyl-CoA 5-hydroxylase/oxidoreductase, partial [Rhodobacteraceae bacterium]|nr:bifunctional salicylyl-CoA 5-hydroxylase/oxidoreductase [Paracoccaceae bacterium]
MRVACLGGGPAGLYFAISMKLKDPEHDVVIIERNQPNDTFGWGVVLSDDALDNLEINDPKSTELIRKNFAYWDDIAVVHDGVRTVSGGHGFAGIGRKKMLMLLQERANELGVEMKFSTEFDSIKSYQKNYDLVVACDGINSRVRAEYQTQFKPDIDIRECKFIWLGTHQKFEDAFTFIFEKTQHGWMWAHVYQFDENTATFIVECQQD